MLIRSEREQYFDTRIILHVFLCVHIGLECIYVRTNDTDFVAILVSYMPEILEIDSNVQVSVVSGVGFNTSCIFVNAITEYIGLKRCKDCDYTSRFFCAWKVKPPDAWLKNSVVFKTFLLYSNRLTLLLAEENLKVIELFVVSLYVTESDVSSSVDKEKYQILKYCGNYESRSSLPTRDALIQHVYKAAYVSGYIWGTSPIPA